MSDSRFIPGSICELGQPYSCASRAIAERSGAERSGALPLFENVQCSNRLLRPPREAAGVCLRGAFA